MQLALIVENNMDFANILIDFIAQNTGYRTIHAANAQAALQIIQQIMPDLFIIDYRLPDIGGMELYQQLQKSPAVKGVPILMVDSTLPQAISMARDMIKATLLFDRDEFIAAIEILLAPIEDA